MPSQYENLAREALLEITPADTVGDYFGETDEGDGAVSVLFDSNQPGYPGWKWTVSIAHIEGSEPTVLEAELMPGEGALLAPDWVPWSDRLADYEAAQEALGDVDADDLDEDDDDVGGGGILHSGDVDGVDIDDLDDDGDGDGDGDDEDESDDDDDELAEDERSDDDEQEKSY
jgi:hypothetical protein